MLTFWLIYNFKRIFDIIAQISEMKNRRKKMIRFDHIQLKKLKLYLKSIQPATLFQTISTTQYKAYSYMTVYRETTELQKIHKYFM